LLHSVVIPSPTGRSNAGEGSGIAISTSKGIVLAFDRVSIFQNREKLCKTPQKSEQIRDLNEDIEIVTGERPEKL
jgi:hypothetical protein